MAKAMYFLKATVGQIDNSKTVKLVIRLEVKVATPHTHVWARILGLTRGGAPHGIVWWIYCLLSTWCQVMVHHYGIITFWKRPVLAS